MERQIERSLFASRWMLVPMYLGLAGALVLLVAVFLIELWKFVLTVPAITGNDAILGVLTLIDLSLTANLLLIVIFSGYENFVSRMELQGERDRPEWQGDVDFSGLKLKLIASIVAISGIHLLKIFMDIGAYSPDQSRWMVVIHLVFVISGVLLAAMDCVADHGKARKKARAMAD